MLLVNSAIKLFIRELSLYFIYSSCISYLSLVIVHLYLNIVVYYQQCTFRNNGPYTKYYNSTIALVYFVTFLVILSNLRVTWKYRNFRIHGQSDRPLVVYLMCLPLLVMSTVALVCISAYIVYIKHNDTILLTISMLIVFVAMLVMLINNYGMKDTGESWTLNYVNSIAILLSLITLISTSGYNLVLMQIFEFIKLHNPDSVPCGHTSYIYLCQVFNKYIRYFQCCIILLSVTLIPYFLEPLQSNISALESHLQLESWEITIRQGNVTSTPSYATFNFIFHIILTAVMVLPVLIFISFDGRYKMALEGITIFYLLLMTVLIVHIFTDVTIWITAPRTQRDYMFYQVILWFGLTGQLVYAISQIFWTVSVKRLSYDNESAIAGMLRNVTEIVQVLLQTILVSALLHRELTQARNWRFKKIFRLINPFWSLGVMNIVLLICVICLTPESKNQRSRSWDSLFKHGVIALSQPIVMLYRGFCGILILFTMR